MSKSRATIGMKILKLLPNQVITSMQADEIEQYKLNVDRILEEFEQFKFTDNKIEEQAELRYIDPVQRGIWIEGAKWMRSQLQSLPKELNKNVVKTETDTGRLIDMPDLPKEPDEIMPKIK